MFWLTSISVVIATGTALRNLHVSTMSNRLFLLLLIVVLVAFNFAIATILAFFWIDAFPWTQPKMLLGLIGYTLGMALLIRYTFPAEHQHLSDHWKILKTYSTILLSSGFIGGIIFGSPAFVRDYVIKSDRWADIATAITLVEITSLYTLILALIMTTGTSLGNRGREPEIVG